MNTGTYTPFLLAQHLAEHLLTRHVQISMKGKADAHHLSEIDHDFRSLAQRLGYRVERIEAPAVTEAA